MNLTITFVLSEEERKDFDITMSMFPTVTPSDVAKQALLEVARRLQNKHDKKYTAPRKWMDDTAFRVMNRVLVEHGSDIWEYWKQKYT